MVSFYQSLNLDYFGKRNTKYDVTDIEHEPLEGQLDLDAETRRKQEMVGVVSESRQCEPLFDPSSPDYPQSSLAKTQVGNEISTGDR